jgi:hypothetical protein
MDNFELDPEFDLSARGRLRRWMMRVINTRYILIALVLHILALVLFGGIILFEALQTKGMFESSNQVFVPTPPGIPPPPATLTPMDVSVEVKLTAAPKPPATVIATDSLSPQFTVPIPEIAMVYSPELEISNDHSQPKVTDDVARLKGVRSFLEGGVAGGSGKRGVSGKGKQTIATFTCYVAKYSGGDWSCNFGTLADGRWYSNCIYNLMTQIDRWTQGKVKANLKPEALNLAHREWIDKVKPPFIFMTGHKDFTFSEAEIENVRQYLMLGGVLWVDNSLPGRRSRFDLAIRREMKRVLPDRKFEVVRKDHRVFASYFQIPGPPSGVNFYQEPIEVINVGGEVAVFYTMNAYSDLWETALTHKDTIDMGQEWSPSQAAYFPRSGHFAVGPEHYPFFRNVTRDSVVASYQLGINIVIHLLTRFQDRFIALPQGDL